MEPRLDRPDGSPDGERDLLEGIPLEIVEHEDRPMIDRESGEGAGERVAVRKGGTGLEPSVDDLIGRDLVAAMAAWRRCLPGDRNEPYTATAAETMTGGIEEHGPKPRLEGRRIAEARQIAPDHHERLLHDVIGIDLVASDRPNVAPRGVDVTRDEPGKGVVVAPLGALDESALAAVFGHYSIGPHWPRKVRSSVGRSIGLLSRYGRRGGLSTGQSLIALKERTFLRKRSVR